jgi:Immunity protein family (Imm11)
MQSDYGFDFSRFHLMEEGFERGALRVRSRSELPADAIHLTRAEAEVVEPIIFDWDEGQRRYDLVGTTWAVLDIVSDRFAALLRERGLTGWRTYPVAICGKDGEAVSGYHGLAVTGRCGPIEWERSERVILPPSVPKGRTRAGWRGLYFTPESWDGSDLFVPADGGGYVIVTDAVKNASEDRRLTNVTFTRLTEFERIWNKAADGTIVYEGTST